MHIHNHDDRQAAVSAERLLDRFRWSILLTVLFVAGEATAGWWYNSLALLADAGHNLADGAALCISWYAIRISGRASSHEKTFGYHRASILAALVNAVSLILIALAIFYEGLQRFIQPEAVSGTAMITVALVAVFVNLLIVVWLRNGGSKDINVRSAVLHMVGDMLFSIGVVIAGFVVVYTGWMQADPLISLFIGVFIVWSSLGILKESIHILMEGAPVEIDMSHLVAAINEIPDVQGVHDLHVWTIASGLPVLTAHIVLDDLAISRGAVILDSVKRRLNERFGIQHATLQLECLECRSGDLYCTLQPDFTNHGAHHHGDGHAPHSHSH